MQCVVNCFQKICQLPPKKICQLSTKKNVPVNQTVKKKKYFWLAQQERSRAAQMPIIHRINSKPQGMEDMQYFYNTPVIHTTIVNAINSLLL